jgi:hypothetical protein
MIGWELSSFLDLIRLIRIAIEHNLRSYANCEVSKDRDDFGKTMQTFALHSLTGSDTTTGKLIYRQDTKGVYPVRNGGGP